MNSSINTSAKILVYTANYGNFDPTVDPVGQSVPFDFMRFSEATLPIRDKSFSTRMQARLIKMFGWQLMPGYDYYLWVDSSCTLNRDDSVAWFVDQCIDLALFKHPNRSTIHQEYEYLKKRLEMKCPYITPRYENEFLEQQMAAIQEDDTFRDTRLFATTSFIYRSSPKVEALMKEWWYHTSRYHSNEQLSMPYVLDKSGCEPGVIPDRYDRCKYLSYVRKHR